MTSQIDMQPHLMTSHIDMQSACRRPVAVRFFVFYLRLVQVWEIEFSHMGKNNRYPELVCKKKLSLSPITIILFVLLFQVQSFLLHFWQGIPNHIKSILDCKVLVTLVGVCDSILYRAIASVLMPTVLQPLPER